MNQQTKRSNSFALFKNSQKTDTNNRPDRTGSAMMTCPHCGEESEHFLDGWIRNDKAGNQYLSGQTKPKLQKAGAPQKQAAEESDSIPF